jgi:hypothetical protein
MDLLGRRIFEMFAMTGEEKKMLAMILFVALVGLVARYFYLKNQKPEAYTPANLPATMRSHRTPVEE